MKNNQLIRRRALKAAGLVMLSGTAGPLLLSRQAGADTKSADDFDGFVAVSKALSGRATLDVALAQHLYKAFQVAVPGFDVALLKLKTALADNPALLEGDKMSFSDQQKGEHALSQALLQAWYLGVVGKEKNALCVTYTDALSNRIVAGTLVPPSFSYGPCGSWQAKP